ncbi:MAG: class I SAM-dependent methyltransferase [Rickettsiales bacterium]
MGNAATSPEVYSTQVRGQYEDYPYPFRDVEKEGTFFSCCDAYSMMAMSHAGWGGKRDMRKGLRILAAGCGTGDAIIHYAEELIGTDAEIVAIDISAKSLEIAQARMKKRGLTGVTFKHMSILDLPEVGLGEFDVVDSSGVLHHLPDPEAGLAALARMLKDDGLMTLMVYAQYGRYSVYLVQELMNKLLSEDMPRAQKISIARDFLNQVPQGHWITVNNALFLEDMRWPDGSGIYDLFLHSTDRAYTVPQIYDWVEGRGLVLNEFFGDLTDDSMYLPESYTNSPDILQLVANKSPRERHAIAELMSGSIAKHFFYAGKQTKTSAQFADDMVITHGPMQHLFSDFVKGFMAALEKAPMGQRVDGNPRPLFAYAPHLYVTKTPHVLALMPLIDGRRSIGEIVALATQQSGSPAAEVRRDLETLYKEYRTRQLVFLRHASIPPYKTGQDIIARVNAFQGRA